MKPLCVLALALTLAIFSTPGLALAGGVTIAQEQDRGRDEVNRYRRMVGMPAVASSADTGSSQLEYGARGHAKYLALETRDSFGHYENYPDSPYFVGKYPKDRAAKYGYSNSSISEDIYWTTQGARGTRTYLQADTAVQWWMSAIYHRFAIVSPRTEHVGYSPYYANGKVYSVLDFGTDYSLTGPVTRYPMPNQTGVGVELSGESPDPLAVCGQSLPGGYPVSMTWYQGSVSLTSATLKRASDGRAVAGCAISPQNDPTKLHYYSQSLSFVPFDSLEYSTKYTANFRGSYNGVPFDYTWSFTTMPPRGALSSSTPANGATNVSRTPDLTLAFSQPLRSYTLVPTPYRGGLDSGGIGLSLARASDGLEAGVTITPPAGTTTRTVSLKPSAALAANTRYRLSYALADSWGRVYRGSIYFTTGP
jgi:uncharacterized protein YkwD